MIGSIVYGDVVEAIHKNRVPSLIARLMFEVRFVSHACRRADARQFVAIINHQCSSILLS